MLPVGTYLAAAALLIIVATAVLLPFLERKSPAIAPPSARDLLELERRSALRAIRELDEDFRTGKLAEADYRALRPEHVQRGAEALRRLAEQAPEPAEASSDQDIDALIEEEILAHRRGGTAAGRAARPCPACGKPTRAGDAFCAHCGARILSQDPA